MQICNACMGKEGMEMECVSFDCPVLYRLRHFADRYSRLALLAGQISTVQPFYDPTAAVISPTGETDEWTHWHKT